MLLLPLFLALFVASSRATKSCEIIGNTNTVLQHVSGGKTWSNARANCQSIKKLGASGDLVSDTTPAVHNFVDAYTYVWIGGSADGSDNWKWVNGQTISRGNKRWHSGMPDGSGTCMVANSPSWAIWDDQPCSTNYASICEHKISGYEFAVDRFVKVVKDEVEWKEAEKKCKEENGLMIVIDSQEIKEWVAKKGSFWVGASDLGHRGKWQWSNGNSLNKTSEFWAPGAPDNQVDAEHCAVMQVDGINDIYCRIHHSYICQYSVC